MTLTSLKYTVPHYCFGSGFQTCMLGPGGAEWKAEFGGMVCGMGVT